MTKAKRLELDALKREAGAKLNSLCFWMNDGDTGLPVVFDGAQQSYDDKEWGITLFCMIGDVSVCQTLKGGYPIDSLDVLEHRVQLGAWQIRMAMPEVLSAKLDTSD